MAVTHAFTLSLFLVGLCAAATPAATAEPTDDMQTLAHMFVALERRDQGGYCAAMNSNPYAGYLGRACQSAVQNKLRKPEACSPDIIAREMSEDFAKCQATTATDFDKATLEAPGCSTLAIADTSLT